MTRAGRPVELTAKEFELLRYLMRNPRRVVSKLQILDRVWSYDFEGRSSIVEIYISYLRKKIEADAPPMIHTVRGRPTASVKRSIARCCSDAPARALRSSSAIDSMVSSI